MVTTEEKNSFVRGLTGRTKGVTPLLQNSSEKDFMSVQNQTSWCRSNIKMFLIQLQCPNFFKSVL